MPVRTKLSDGTTRISYIKSDHNPNEFKIFQMIDNYIYFYHMDKFIILPLYTQEVTDAMGAQWNPTSPLGRSAPIQSYGSSGPRTLNFSFDLHRDMMTQINAENTSFKYNDQIVDAVADIVEEDYVDIMLRYLQTAVVPNYRQATKMIDPPIVAVRMGQDLYIKGVVGNMQLTYHAPILRNGKYAYVSVSFSVTESDPFSAEDIATMGSNRIVDQTLERKLNGTFTTYNSDDYADYTDSGEIPRNAAGEERAEEQSSNISDLKATIIRLAKQGLYSSLIWELVTAVLSKKLSKEAAHSMIKSLSHKKNGGLSTLIVAELEREFDRQLVNRT